MQIKTETIHNVDGEEAEEFVANLCGRRPDVDSEDVDYVTEDTGVLSFNVEPGTVLMDTEGKTGMWLMRAVFTNACLAGDIPAGRYVVTYQWG